MTDASKVWEESTAHGLMPMGVFEVSFVVTSVLCLTYAIALPLFIYIDTGIVFFSDVSVYFTAAALALFLVGRAFAFTESARRRP